ncbi:type I phosphomannose isomerase catalytic subunit [Saccharicrinis sp. FJH62]|uniref:type I phosphomannose isomerase catalytic subunit n=1 Tax=Saccharicrinis sp. FJH62 TaxID=3344657 RepID=UPI0035D43536
MSLLYPIKFEPVLHEKIWGGSYLKEKLNKNAKENSKVGESLEISSVEGSVSVVSNGFLAGNPLDELIEVYMGDLVGDAVFEKFGTVIPLLIKFIDANADLSIQVHPDDEYAAEHHGKLGKNEMWYVMDAKPGAYIIPGFSKEVTREEVQKCIDDGNFEDILTKFPVKKGDVFMIPVGRVHALCAGVVVAEIQQTSDVTYRLYDYNRKDDNGNLRELHIEDSLNVIDYSKPEAFVTNYEPELNKAVNLQRNKYFTVNMLHLDQSIKRDYYLLDSFEIIMCVEGEAVIESENEPVTVKAGETVLIPAELREISFIPKGEAKLLEIYYEADFEQA